MSFSVQDSGEPTNVVRILENSQITFAASGTAGQSDLLPFGSYDVWCDEADIYVKVATTANDVTASTGYKILKGNIVPVLLNTNYRLGAITGGTSGTVRMHRTTT